jgi:hypothetical protein
MRSSKNVCMAMGLALVALSCLVWRAAGAADASGVPATGNADIYGRWRIVKVLDYADITSITEKQAQALVGKVVIVGKDKFVFGRETCDAPTYERTVEDTAKTMREKGHVSSVNMGLPDPVTVIDAGCTDIFLKRPNLIVVHWNGFYFDAVRGR